MRGDGASGSYGVGRLLSQRFVYRPEEWESVGGKMLFAEYAGQRCPTIQERQEAKARAWHTYRPVTPARVRQRRRAESGFCPECGTPHDGKHSRCVACLDKIRVWSIERRSQRRAAGVCLDCGKPVEGLNAYKRLRCFACRLARAQNERVRRARGVMA